MHIDRSEQLNDAARAIGGNGPHRAVFFEGAEGVGKTSLLTEVHRRHSDRITLYVDLAVAYDQTDVLATIAREASVKGLRTDSFRTLQQRYAELPSVVIRDSEIKKSNVEMAFNVNGDRKLQNSVLTDELVATLAAARAEQAPVLLLDSFEKCQKPMRDWLCGFLNGLLAAPEVTVFLAGRSVPTLTHPDAARRTRTLVLNPFDTAIVEEWIELTGIEDLKGLGSVIWRGTAGLPARISEFLSNFSAGNG
ncbi:AAA family ATPase [Streptomyces sp. NPDC057623]|uniref:AAA family ATPase n=1 Tax=Streptomyces sp. NPDC057623 TaxID=3346187 RepID=UPI0036CF634F